MTTSIGRRSLLTGSLAAAALVPLASCATGGGGDTGASAPATSAGTADNPFNVAKGSKVDAVIFKGGYGSDYVDFAAEQMKTKMDVTATIATTTAISDELQPRFAGGTPPDIIDNSGAKAIGISTIIAQLEDLSSVLKANNYEGTPIDGTLFSAVVPSGTFDGKLASLNYVMTVYGMWYSASLFKAKGYTPPTTWDEAYELGKQAKADGKYLFLFGKEAASYYLTTMLNSSVKAGGDDVRLKIENLKPDAYSQDAVVQVFDSLGKIIADGMMKPGGEGTQFTAAQAQWSNGEEALLYPSGSWIENEMKSQTKEGFEMTGMPELSLSSSDKMPHTALRAEAGEAFIVPTKGANMAGGKELMRAMLSKEAATNFAKTRLAPTVVKNTVPDDAFGSTALKSQIKMLSDAGDNVFPMKSIGYYGMNKDNLVQMNSFLSGKIDATTLRTNLQAIVDKVANDSSVKKIEFK